MMPPNAVYLDDFWWADPPLKKRLLSDPIGVLKDRGINVPAHLPPQVFHEVARIVMLLWVDGRLVPVDRFHIDPSDEGLLFGRGVWESTRTINAVPWLWTRHIDRLKKTLDLLEIQYDAKLLPDEATATKYVRDLSPQDVILRLNVTAGRPGHHGMIWMSAGLRPMPPKEIRLQTRLSSVRTDQPYTLWKTFHYAHRLRTGAQSFGPDFDSALTTDEAGNVQEAAHANIFFRFKEGWVTPPLSSGLLLPGTLRQHLLEESPLKAKEAVVPKAKCAEALEVFTTNSNVGIVPVTRIDDTKYAVGSETMSLMRWLDPASRTAVDPVKFV